MKREYEILYKIIIEKFDMNKTYNLNGYKGFNIVLSWIVRE